MLYYIIVPTKPFICDNTYIPYTGCIKYRKNGINKDAISPIKLLLTHLGIIVTIKMLNI